MADMAMIVVKLAANSVETKHVNKRRALVHTVVWKDTPERIAINVSRFLVFFIMLIFQIHFHLPNLPWYLFVFNIHPFLFVLFTSFVFLYNRFPWERTWPFNITNLNPPHQRMIYAVCSDDVCPSFANFPYFHRVLQNHWTNFNQTWYKTSLSVCLFGVNRPTRENVSLIWSRYHYRWGAANFDLCSVSLEGSFACHMYCDTGHSFKMVISEDVTLTLIAERLAVELWLPAFTT